MFLGDPRPAIPLYVRVQTSRGSIRHWEVLTRLTVYATDLVMESQVQLPCSAVYFW
jgi:hypothetical protein